MPHYRIDHDGQYALCQGDVVLARSERVGLVLLPIGDQREERALLFFGTADEAWAHPTRQARGVTILAGKLDLGLLNMAIAGAGRAVVSEAMVLGLMGLGRLQLALRPQAPSTSYERCGDALTARDATGGVITAESFGAVVRWCVDDDEDRYEDRYVLMFHGTNVEAAAFAARFAGDPDVILKTGIDQAELLTQWVQGMGRELHDEEALEALGRPYAAPRVAVAEEVMDETSVDVETEAEGMHL